MSELTAGSNIDVRFVNSVIFFLFQNGHRRRNIMCCIEGSFKKSLYELVEFKLIPSKKRMHFLGNRLSLFASAREEGFFPAWFYAFYYWAPIGNNGEFVQSSGNEYETTTQKEHLRSKKVFDPFDSAGHGTLEIWSPPCFHWRRR